MTFTQMERRISFDQYIALPGARTKSHATVRRWAVAGKLGPVTTPTEKQRPFLVDVDELRQRGLLPAPSALATHLVETFLRELYLYFPNEPQLGLHLFLEQMAQFDLQPLSTDGSDTDASLSNQVALPASADTSAADMTTLMASNKRWRRRRPLYWNTTCKVTAGQIIISDGTPHGYRIEKSRLLELATHEPPLYDWPMHLAGKGWLSNSDFAKAFLAAVKAWGLNKFDPIIWQRTMDRLRAHPHGWY